MTKRYLRFYKKCMKTGKMPGNGLCQCFQHDKLLDLLGPDEEYWCWFWGTGYRSGTLEHANTMCGVFTEMRQNIVLFMAAMAGEL